MKKLIFILSVLSLSACAMKQKVLDVSAVSMSHANISAEESLKEIGPVTGQFCTSTSQKGVHGLMDESTKDAQRSSKADFILNATFYQQGTCMTVEGTGARIQSTQNAAADTDEQEDKPARRRSKIK